MRKKKDLPLVILQALESFVNLKGDKFEIVDPKDFLLKAIDKDSESTFEFLIEQYRKENQGRFLFLMTRSPKDVYDNGKYQIWVEVSGLRGQFDTWIKLLDQYETINSFFDAPLTKAFKDEFYTEFEIIDEDAETTPLKTKQILLLDTYLENVDKKLSEFITGKNSNDIKEIQKDIIVLRDNLTSKSKKWVVNKLTTIWSKIAKQGTKFIKEFLTESKKELIKQSVKGMFDCIKENATDTLT